MIQRIRNIVLIFCAGLVLPLAAEEVSAGVPAPDAGQTVARIEVTGLKKTKPGYVQSLLQEFCGVPEHEVDMQKVETLLRTTNLFSDIAVGIQSADDGARVLHVAVSEKISFIPLPFFMYSDGSVSFGGFVMNANVFGTNNMAMGGAIISFDSLMGMFLFSKRPKDMLHPGFSVSSSVMKRDEEIKNAAGEKLFSYGYSGFNADFSVREKLGPYLMLDCGIGYANRFVDTKVFDSVQLVSFSAGADLSVQNWTGWFLSAKSVTASGEIALDFDGGLSKSVRARGTVQQPVFGRARLLANAAVYWAWDSHKSMYKRAGEVGVSILSSGFRTEKAAGGTAGIECALFRTGAGLFSVYGLGECVYAEDFVSESILHCGASFGVKMYLSKIAFPAFSLGYARNFTANSGVMSVSLGVGM